MTSPEPRVSVITPTYDRAHLLPRVWASLERQTERRFQWIVVDDGSSDGTADVVSGFNDPRVTFVRQANRGCNSARTRGEREVRAPYVVFLDSDDELYDEETLAVMLREIESAPTAAGSVGFAVVDERGAERYSFVKTERAMLTYDDVVCEEKARGEFLFIYRVAALAAAPWPDVNGVEALRHWAIARDHPPLFVRRPARIYHRDRADSLTSAPRAIEHAAELADGLSRLIDDHRDAWLRTCPQQHGRYLFYVAMYRALEGRRREALRCGLSSWSARGPRGKTAALMAGLLLPTGLRRRWFVWRANRSAAPADTRPGRAHGA